jgi:uncharacterized membrane protein
MNPTNFDAVNLLATIPLLQGLDVEALVTLAPQTEFRSYRAGELLFTRGDPGGALMIVVGGQVEIFIIDEKNQEVILTTIDPGGFFGEVTLFDGSPRTTSARAPIASRLLVLQRDVMTAFLNKHPQAAIHMINVLSHRLKQTTALVAERPRDAIQMLNSEMSIWQRIATRAADLMGSWKYLTILLAFVVAWMGLNTTGVIGTWDKPPEFFTLVTILTLISSVATPLILINQRRQDHLDRIRAEQDHQTNLKTELAILDVRGKLEWLQEATLENAGKMEQIERNEEVLIRKSRPVVPPVAPATE